MDINEVLINVISSVIAVEYMDHSFEKKYNGLRRRMLFAAGCCLYFFTLTGLNSLFQFEGLLCVFYGGALVIYGLTLKGGLPDKVFLSLMWILITLLGTFNVFGVLGLLTGKSMQEMQGIEGGLFVGASLAAAALKFLMGRIVTRLYSKKAGMHRSEDRMIAGALVLILLTGLGIFQLELGGMEGRARYGIILGLLAGEFGSVLLLESVYRRLGDYQRERMEQEFCRQQEISREESLMEIYYIGREINHWRHDMNGRLEVLYRLQKKGNYAEVERELEKACEKFLQYPELPQETGNEGLNAALIRAISKCRNERIRFYYIVMGKPDKIDNVDMGTLMCNLFDNGIEACVQCANERVMEVMLRSEDEKTEIRLENSVREEVLKNNPNLISSKKSMYRHGFGMETIYGVIEKYQGEYSCFDEEGRFVQEICLRHKGGTGLEK